MTAVQIEQLRSRIRGSVIEPADSEYDAARRVYNAMIDKRPAAILRAADVADVIEAVNFARTNDVLTAIRGGGHNGGGLGTCDDGLVIDLSRMKGIRVDPTAGTVRVQAGCTGGDMDHATHAFGMATPSGTVSSTGMAGLTLGGGIGHLTRTYGLTIDNLLEVDMGLADGRFVTATEKEHPDLFWAVRGGGGNFGVVTSFLFRLHPVKTVNAGPTFWPLEQAPEVMKAYQDFILQAPEDVNGFFAFLTVPPVPLFPAELHMRKVCGIIWCSTAAPEKAERVT
jgi:FAD/FMN-containing dehydrogenase